MSAIRTYHNASCLKCEKVRKEMIMVGPMIFCSPCFEEEFKNEIVLADFSVNSTNPRYKEWLKKYKDHLDEEHNNG
jgi:hypothetical protein